MTSRDDSLQDLRDDEPNGGACPIEALKVLGHAGAPRRLAGRSRSHLSGGCNTYRATLLKRTFRVDVLCCGRCGGRMKVLAVIDDVDAAQTILQHLRLPHEVLPPMKARAPPQATFDFGA